MAEAEQPARQPLWFLLLIALAVAGGAVAYIPFLTILLPVKVIAMGGTDDVAVLSYAAFAGAVAASFANILFGWLSDRSGSRRIWIAIGMVLSSIMLTAMRDAQTPQTLIAFLIAWQIGLNMMLGPLAAWAGDCVPDAQKGLLGGLFAFAPALGALAGAFVTIPGLAAPDARLVLVAAIVVMMVLPVLIIGGGREMPQLMAAVHRKREGPRVDATVARMWLARLLVQIAEAALFAFLLLWLRSIVPDFGDDDAAQVFSVVLLLSVPVALMVGRWSDTSGRPILPLAISVGFSAIGLLVMSLSAGLTSALAGYIVFGLASTVFLSLHSSQVLRVLPRPQNRGRDLGVFNLTNTVPSLIMPWIALALVPVFGFDALFLLLAVLAGLAGLLLASISRPI